MSPPAPEPAREAEPEPESEKERPPPPTLPVVAGEGRGVEGRGCSRRAACVLTAWNGLVNGGLRDYRPPAIQTPHTSSSGLTPRGARGSIMTLVKLCPLCSTSSLTSAYPSSWPPCASPGPYAWACVS